MLKAPIQLDTTGCSTAARESAQEEEEFSRDCSLREKLIFSILPANDWVVPCSRISDTGIRFPYFRNGDLRAYLLNHNAEITTETRMHWVYSAVQSVIFIHSFGILHADISARNFLVADDGSAKLSDFAGSAIGDKQPLVSEETRYRQIHGVTASTHSIQTELFALGCLIYEIMTGVRPYEDIDNEATIEERYRTQTFPSLDNVTYANIIKKCWSRTYQTADDVAEDLKASVSLSTRQMSLQLR